MLRNSSSILESPEAEGRLIRPAFGCPCPRRTERRWPTPTSRALCWAAARSERSSKLRTRRWVADYAATGAGAVRRSSTRPMLLTCQTGEVVAIKKIRVGEKGEVSQGKGLAPAPALVRLFVSTCNPCSVQLTPARPGSERNGAA